MTESTAASASADASFAPEVAEEIQKLGLDPATVARHRQRLLLALSRGEKPLFRVIDTCRIDNGGILPPSALACAAAVAPPAVVEYAKTHPGAGFAAFVPAAGAASRYSAPLAALVDALEQTDGDAALLPSKLEALAAAGARSWPLPSSVHALLDNPAAAVSLDESARAALVADLSLPKALMPCVKEGTTFLDLKLREHAAIVGLCGEIYVTPPGHADRFAAAAGRSATRLFLEQGPALSTLRFTRDGDPVRDGEGELALVPAGHGALANLFPAAFKNLPDAHSLFIRNIDNVMGMGAQALDATHRFLSLHSILMAAMRCVRAALNSGDLEKAATGAAPLSALLEILPPARDAEAVDRFLATLEDPSERALFAVQLRLFSTRIPDAAQLTGSARLTHLKWLYSRPFNIMGQVPNTAKDIGGTPCFVETRDGIEKVTIEVPHVSAADKTAYLADPARATHFNPVFVAAEIIRDDKYYAERNQDFWLLAEKTYRGQPVYYHETVLYELLSNGGIANALFVEVPRLIFNPHKSLQDAVNRSLSDWS